MNKILCKLLSLCVFVSVFASGYPNLALAKEKSNSDVSESMTPVTPSMAIAEILSNDEREGVVYAKDYLTDADPLVRAQAFTAIEEFGSYDDIADLEQLAKSSSTDFATEAKEALALLQMRTETNKQKLLNLAKEGMASTSLKVRNKALRVKTERFKQHDKDSTKLLTSETNGDKQKIKSGQDATVSVKLLEDQPTVQVTVTNLDEPNVPIVEETFADLKANQKFSYTWKTDRTTKPGFYKIRFDYPKADSSASDEFTIVNTYPTATTAELASPSTNDTYEPNNTADTAYALPPGSYTSYLSYDGDFDYYQFTFPQDGAVNFVVAEPASVNYTLYVSKPGITWGATKRSTTSGNLELRLTVSANEVYTVKIFGKPVGTTQQPDGTTVFHFMYSDQEPYQLSVTPEIKIDSFEPNDYWSDATVLSENTTINSYISSQEEVDYYSITPTTSGMITFQLIPPASTTTFTYTVTDETLHTLIPAGSGLSQVSSAVVTAGKKYYIKVSSTGQWSGNPYSLSISPVYPDSYESNDSTTTATPLVLGEPITSYISKSVDLDYFTLTSTSDCNMKLNLTVPQGVGYSVEVLDGNANKISSRSNGPGQKESLYFPVRANTPYYIKINGITTNDFSNMPYTLRVSPDTYEDNDTVDKAWPMSYDTTYTSYISSGDDLDTYKFVAANTGMNHISVKVPSDQNYDVTIYDDNQKIIATGTNGVGTPEEVPFHVIAGKTYYISISSPSGQWSINPYSFRMTLQKWIYQYDASNRLTSINATYGFNLITYTYSYDLNGNLLNTTKTITLLN